jgi:hypothetical protein
MPMKALIDESVVVGIRSAIALNNVDGGLTKDKM